MKGIKTVLKKVAFSRKRGRKKCLYGLANSHIAEQASYLAESPHGQLPFKRGTASSVFKKSLAFLPNKTLVKRYLTLLTTKCLFFCFTKNTLGLQRPILTKYASTDDC